MKKQQALEAVRAHQTVFFDRDLQPVQPKVGMWFCEFDDLRDDCDELSGEALVEYLGPCDAMAWDDSLQAFAPHGAPMLRHRVATEYSDSDRRPCGLVLIRQGGAA